MKLTRRQKLFEKPSAAFRGKPFWAWNGKLDEAELKRQIDVMREMGFGGFGESGMGSYHGRNGFLTFSHEKSKEKILYNIITLSGERLKNYGDYDFLKNIQVITPTKKGDLGTKELNKILQQTVNPSSETKKERKYISGNSFCHAVCDIGIVVSGDMGTGCGA